jgi:hypothetical protein
MTAHGSRRLALVIAVATLALAGWWFWPRHALDATGAARARDVARMTAASSRRTPVPAMDPAEPASGSHPDAGASTDSDEAIACLSARRARLRRVEATLDPSRSAQDALAHAVLGGLALLLAGGDEDAQRRDAIRLDAEWQAARQRWPRDIDIAWQAAHNCMAMNGCDEDAALDHLLAVDPGNAAAWWFAMGEAWARGDAAAYDDALAHAAAARGADARTGSIFLAMQPLLAQAPLRERCLRADDDGELATALGREPNASDWASIEAWSYELAFNSPVSYSAFAGCRERDEARLPQRRREDCIAALSVLARGDTLIEQFVALPPLIQLEGDSPAGLEYRERYRQLLYLIEDRPPALVHGDPTSLLSSGEIETMRRAAISRHRWPPPAYWLPASTRKRSLITRGRLPPGSDG